MKCNICNAEISENASFCGKCGAKVEDYPAMPIPNKKYCIKCEQELPDDAQFCSNCGSRTNEMQSYQEVNMAFHSFGENPTIGHNGLNSNDATPFLSYQQNMGFKVSSTFWIMGLRIASYVSFFAVCILGIFLWVQFADYGNGGFGFVIFLLCVVVGFLCVAGIMLFLDMALDIRKLRKK